MVTILVSVKKLDCVATMASAFDLAVASLIPALKSVRVGKQPSWRLLERLCGSVKLAVPVGPSALSSSMGAEHRLIGVPWGRAVMNGASFR